jgi:hypothetical protein
MPRPTEIVLPLLRAANLKVKDLDNVEHPVTVNSWVPDIDFRKFPMVQVRRLGGIRNPKRPTLLATPVIEMTVYTKAPEGGLQETEQLYEDALEALYTAVRKQTQTPKGYLHSMFETLGATQFSSLYQDSWRVQGLIQLGIRPPRSA